MKIAYLFFEDITRESGVLKKILDQTAFWLKQGHEVRLFALSLKKGPIWGKLLQRELEVVDHAKLSKGFWSTKTIQEKIREWNPDLIYFRQGMYYPALGLLERQYPTILEINSNDIEEAKQLTWWKYFYYRLTRGFIVINASGIVCVSNQMLGVYRRYNKPTVVIGNGLDLKKYNQLPPTNNKEPRLVFIGSPGNAWHGIDKLLKIAILFPDWRFDVIGYERPENEDFVPSNVAYWGYLPRLEYEQIVKHADIALGTLSLYRSGLDETSTLKLREYLAYGIPTIIGHKDPDFLKPTPYILELPNTDWEFVDRELIEAFVYNWMGKRVNRNEILHIDGMYKETLRLEFFKKTVLGKEYRKKGGLS